jgi:hypothetical protein
MEQLQLNELLANYRRSFMRRASIVHRFISSSLEISDLLTARIQTN